MNHVLKIAIILIALLVLIAAGMSMKSQRSASDAVIPVVQTQTAPLEEDEEIINELEDVQMEEEAIEAEFDELESLTF